MRAPQLGASGTSSGAPQNLVGRRGTRHTKHLHHRHFRDSPSILYSIRPIPSSTNTISKYTLVLRLSIAGESNEIERLRTMASNPELQVKLQELDHELAVSYLWPCLPLQYRSHTTSSLSFTTSRTDHMTHAGRRHHTKGLREAAHRSALDIPRPRRGIPYTRAQSHPLNCLLRQLLQRRREQWPHCILCSTHRRQRRPTSHTLKRSEQQRRLRHATAQSGGPLPGKRDGPGCAQQLDRPPTVLPARLFRHR